MEKNPTTNYLKRNEVKFFVTAFAAFYLLIGSDSLKAFAAVPTIEREALIALFNSTGGDTWSIIFGWKDPPVDDDGFAEPGTECNWYGVSCNEEKTTVIGLSLYSNLLYGNIPPELENLENLQYLFLYSNFLRGSIPSELGTLSNLTEIELNTNQLTGSIPPELGRLANLQWLSLWKNKLTGSIPPELGNLANLQLLELDNNQLTGSIPAELGNLANFGNLEGLWLSSNRLEGNIPPELGNLVSLQDLWLDDNLLTGSIPPEIGNLVDLIELGLGLNLMTGLIPSDLGDLEYLEVLELNDAGLLGEIPGELMGLNNLDYLDICHNHLYTNDPDLRDFLNSRQDGGDWESCQTPCVGDFDQDDDIDGLDLANYFKYPECIDLEGFAGNFGKAAAIDFVE